MQRITTKSRFSDKRIARRRGYEIPFGGFCFAKKHPYRSARLEALRFLSFVEKIAVGTGAGESKRQHTVLHGVDQKPIGFNVAFAEALGKR